jgi:hypothetical protein
MKYLNRISLRYLTGSIEEVKRQSSSVKNECGIARVQIEYYDSDTKKDNVKSITEHQLCQFAEENGWKVD